MRLIAIIAAWSLLTAGCASTPSLAAAQVKEAAQGATHVVFTSIDGGIQVSTGKAVAGAYRCR